MMCPFVLASENPIARKEHQCMLCDRTIEVGERYNRQRNIGDDGPYVFKACAHCRALTQVSTAMEYADSDSGYTRDDFHEWEPGTVQEAVWRERFKRQWRRHDGTLYPLPAQATADQGGESDG